MKLIIAGSRSLELTTGLISNMVEVLREELKLPPVSTVISGGARGVDACGERYAEKAGIPIERFEADWRRYGSSAGPIRNGQMAEAGDALLLIWNGESPGSRSMLGQARAHDLPVLNATWQNGVAGMELEASRVRDGWRERWPARTRMVDAPQALALEAKAFRS